MAYTQYDVAYMKWGGSWHMPTKEQTLELLHNSISEWTQLNGVYGCKVTSTINGKSIFLPAAGYRQHGALKYSGTKITYWISYRNSYLFWWKNSQLTMMGTAGSATDENGYDYYYGFSVRPVSD